MNSIIFVGLLCACIALAVAIDTSVNSEENEVDRGQHGHHGHHGHHRHHHHHHRHHQQDLNQEHQKCSGLEEVDLSDFNLNIEDLHKLAESLQGQHEDMESNEILEDEQYNELKITATGYGLGSETKVLVTPNKTRTFSKTLKASMSNSDLTTSITGSWNTSVVATTQGSAGFTADLTIFARGSQPTATVKGDSSVESTSSTRWVKKHDHVVLETQTNASSATTLNVGYKPTDQHDENVEVELNVTSTVSSTSGTVFLSAHCLGSKASSAFNTKLAGQGWATDVSGTAKTNVFSHILYANKNGSSVTWTFARTVVKAQTQIGNLTASQYIVVKSFTETLTRPAPSKNGGMTLIVSAEHKIRYDTKTRVTGGYRVYSSGGELSQSNSVVNIPASVMEDEEENHHQGVHHVLVSEDYAKAHLMRSQVQAEETITSTNPMSSVHVSIGE